jgi:gluconate kinase
MKVVLHIDPRYFAFAQAMAKRQGHFGPADYLNSLLNTAILTAIDEEDWPIQRGPASAASDLDDGIPF